MTLSRRDLGPKDLEPLCGFDAAMLKEWRRLHLLDGIGKPQESGRWKYTLQEAVTLAICNQLRLAGLPGYVAIKIAKDITVDTLKATGYFGASVAPGFEMLAIWNNEASGQDAGTQGFTSPYLPWASMPVDDYEVIRRHIRAPAPIVADLYKITVAFPDQLKGALARSMREVRGADG